MLLHGRWVELCYENGSMADRGMAWVRVDVGLPRHPKLRRLCSGCWNEPRWRVGTSSGCGRGPGSFFPTGKLSASASEIETELSWAGATGDLMRALVDLKIVDASDDGFRVHGWGAHNGKQFLKVKKDRERAAKRYENHLREVSAKSPRRKARESAKSPAVQNETEHNGTLQFKVASAADAPGPSWKEVCTRVHEHARAALRAPNLAFTGREAKALSLTLKAFTVEQVEQVITRLADDSFVQGRHGLAWIIGPEGMDRGTRDTTKRTGPTANFDNVDYGENSPEGWILDGRTETDLRRP